MTKVHTFTAAASLDGDEAFYIVDDPTGTPLDRKVTPAVINTYVESVSDAVLNADTTTAGMSFVIDEDTMVSDLATKVPTQQSTKAYVDAQVTAGTPAASDTVAGIVELATIAETDTGTDATRALTPAGLAGSALQATADGAIAESLVDAKGDIIAATADNTAARLAVGTDGQVLAALASEATGLVWQDAAASTQEQNAQTGTTYTYVLTDAEKLVTLSNAAAITVTVPPNSSVAFAVGTVIDNVQIGAGQVTFAEGAGVTINYPSDLSLLIAAQYGYASLVKRGTDEWDLVGLLEPAGGSYVTAASFPVELVLACSDESTAIDSTGEKLSFRAPWAFTLTDVRASLISAATTGTFTVDINESGTTVLSTKLTVDATELTSTTAAAAHVISDSVIADDAEITIDVDNTGDDTATGLKVVLYGTRVV